VREITVVALKIMVIFRTAFAIGRVRHRPLTAMSSSWPSLGFNLLGFPARQRILTTPALTRPRSWFTLYSRDSQRLTAVSHRSRLHRRPRLQPGEETRAATHRLATWDALAGRNKLEKSSDVRLVAIASILDEFGGLVETEARVARTGQRRVCWELDRGRCAEQDTARPCSTVEARLDAARDDRGSVATSRRRGNPRCEPCVFKRSRDQRGGPENLTRRK
jgi:hypothetical protein